MYNESLPQQKEKGQEKKCSDSDTPTRTTVNNKKNDYCGVLKTKVGILEQNEETYIGCRIEYEHKKCRFVKTEKNYRVLRNVELSIGTTLIRASTNIESEVTDCVGYDKKLAGVLSDLLATIKTTKTKFAELWEGANNLLRCSKDSCNRSQMAILTGEKIEDCDDKQKPEHRNEHEPRGEHERVHPHGKRPPECENAGEILRQLIHEPASLGKEIDIILNSTADVVGIQTFSNISSLPSQFLPAIKDNAKAFDKVITDTITKSTAELTVAQTNLVQVTSNLNDAVFGNFKARIDVDVTKGIKDFLCDHACECLCDGEGRLDDCKCKICDICKEVTKIYSNETKDQQPTTPAIQ
jgi:hypothetical protein